MAINLFEGARRIAQIITVISLLWAIAAAFVDSPIVDVTYEVTPIQNAAVRMPGNCPSDAASDSTFAKTRSGRTVRVWLCVRPILFSRSEQRAEGDRKPWEMHARGPGQLIPYKIDTDGTVWGAQPFSSEVNGYLRSVSNRFAFPPNDEPEIDRLWWDAKWSQLGWGAAYVGGGLAIFWVCVWAIGWVIRGFLGIQSGADR